MSRKPKKGYFVRGQFVAEGSELDLELKAELKGTNEASRTDLKRESTELQKLGEATADAARRPVGAPAPARKLTDALAEARRITNFEGKRRQMQYVGKLMRKLDEATLEAVRAALDEQHSGSAETTLALHQAEQWRDRLIADDDAIGEWLTQFPGTDIRSSCARWPARPARTPPPDKTSVSQGLAPRQGRAYREIFQLVREQMEAGDEE
jgi:ribosome-associated protein